MAGAGIACVAGYDSILSFHTHGGPLWVTDVEVGDEGCWELPSLADSRLSDGESQKIEEATQASSVCLFKPVCLFEQNASTAEGLEQQQCQSRRARRHGQWVASQSSPEEEKLRVEAVAEQEKLLKECVSLFYYSEQRGGL